MKRHPDRDDVVISADLLAPEGYGEIIGGSERDTDYIAWSATYQGTGLDLKEYSWYLDLRKYGSQCHTQASVGLERAVTWITGEEHIREAIHSRTMNRLWP